MKKKSFQFLFITIVTLWLCFLTINAHALSSEQIKQIEDIAQEIALQHNKNASAMLDQMTVSSRAIAISRNVRFENVLRVKKGLSSAQLKEYQDALRQEIVPGVCKQNANNPAFDRGLFYTFIYINTYGEKLAEITINKKTCRKYK